MLAILLTILKVIGIVILSILGLILGIVLLVLLVPIRYDANGELYEEKKIRIRVHWLLHLLHVVVELKGKLLDVTVKILGITVFSLAKKNEQDSKEDTTTVSQETIQVETVPTTPIQSAPTEVVQEQLEKNEVPVEEEQQEEPLQTESLEAQKEEPLQPEPSEEKQQDNRTFFEKLEDKMYQIADSIADKLEHIEQTMEQLQEKIDNIKRIVSHYTKLISHERTQRLIKRLFGALWDIIRYIMPTKLKTDLHVGMDDPATTGQICMYASMLYPVYKDNIKLEPDFEQKVLEGTFYFKGRIRLGHFIVVAVKLIANRDFWFVIRHIKPKEKKKSKEKNDL